MDDEIDLLRRLGEDLQAAAHRPERRAWSSRHRWAFAAPVAVAAAVVAIVITVVFSPFGSEHPSPSRTGAALSPSPSASIVEGFLPGAHVAFIASAAAPVGYPHVPAVKITAPRALFGSGMSAVRQHFLDDDLGWRAQIAASLIALKHPAVQRWTLAAIGGRTPDRDSDAFHGGTGTNNNRTDPSLDMLPVSAAIAQMTSNLRVLTSVLPTGSLVTDKITVYLAGNGSQQYALEVDVTVTSAASLEGHYGDVLDGLQTGLASGDLANDPVEGLAIVVTDRGGEPLVGAWATTRASGGSLQFADPKPPSGSLAPTARYPDLTGGPTTKTTVLGGAE